MVVCVVPPPGLEPGRLLSLGILSPVRLPVPPRGHGLNARFAWRNMPCQGARGKGDFLCPKDILTIRAWRAIRGRCPELLFRRHNHTARPAGG